MDWKQLEDHVRTTASYIWDCAASAETINGIRLDAVLRPKPDHWVVIEISKENTLDKLRIDLAKFATLRPHLFLENVYAECYFVTEDDSHPSLRVSGEGSHVQVHSVKSFEAMFIDYERYFHVRSQEPFGSAIDPESGTKDLHKYTQVKYRGLTVDKEFVLADIARLMTQGKRIILIGNFGTGKSRCIQELFTYLGEMQRSVGMYPTAIDLRDNWGVKRGTEMLRRHFDDLGLSNFGDAAVKIMRHDRGIYLIDGFDEIGSQSWSDDVTALQQIRKRSLEAVRDLVANTKGSVLITGREHYFNSTAEMFDCLGLKESDTIVIQCSDEFTESEAHDYLKHLSKDFEIPQRIPRRPLVYQLLSRMEPSSLELVQDDQLPELSMWLMLHNALCEREAKINSALDAGIVRAVLRRLARITREKSGNLGPLSPAEINQAFADVTNTRPVDESAAMLQRFMVLGRVGPDSADRQFVDNYFLDGLRADDIMYAVSRQEEQIVDLDWVNPMQDFGIRLVAEALNESTERASYVRFMKNAAKKNNRVLAGELISAILIAWDESFDFQGVVLGGSYITSLDFTNGASNLQIVDSIIEMVDITQAEVKNVTISKSGIGKVIGVSAKTALPPWIPDCDVDAFESMSTVARIKVAPISDEQRVLVAIIKKTFFQPGSGRKEEALLRGLGNLVTSGMLKRIINRLIKEGILTEQKGEQGAVFIPNRSHTRRMRTIIDQLTLCKDPLWTEFGK